MIYDLIKAVAIVVAFWSISIGIVAAIMMWDWAAVVVVFGALFTVMVILALQAIRRGY